METLNKIKNEAIKYRGTILILYLYSRVIINKLIDDLNSFNIFDIKLPIYIACIIVLFIIENKKGRKQNICLRYRFTLISLTSIIIPHIILSISHSSMPDVFNLYVLGMLLMLGIVFYFENNITEASL